MAPLNANFEVAERPAKGADHVNLDAKLLAKHAPRIAHPATSVYRVIGRNRMKDVTPLRLEVFLRVIDEPRHIMVGHFTARNGCAHTDRLAFRLCTGKTHHYITDRDTGHALGRIHRDADRLFRSIHIHHRTRADAPRHLMAYADDTHGSMTVRKSARLNLGDEAGNLVRADIQRRNNARAPHSDGPTLKTTRSQRDHIHVLPPRAAPTGRPTLLPAFACIAIPRPLAAVSVNSTDTRSGRRRSTDTMSRERILCFVSCATSVARATDTPVSGSFTSTPFSRRRFQRRSPTRTKARTRCKSCGCSALINFRSSGVSRGAPNPTMKGRCAKSCTPSSVIGRPEASISESSPPRCQRAKGSRSVISIRIVSGRRRVTVAVSTQPSRSIR